MSSPSASYSTESVNTIDKMARLAGIMLLATAALTIIMVYTRVQADVDRSTMLLSLQAIANNSLMYSLSGAARLVSGATFVVAGLLLLRTWIIRERWATPLVPYLFVLSGAFTVASGACALLIAFSPALEAVSGTEPSTSTNYTVLGFIYNLRWITGKIGFTAAGIALLVASRYQWRVGSTLRKIAPASAILGAAMQFIWLDSATIIHPIIGTVFFLWLLVIGFMLATGRVERHFIAVRGNRV